MTTSLALGSIRTEAGHVVRAEDAALMLQLTLRTTAAKATIVPGTLLHFVLLVDMQKQAFFVAAGIVPKRKFCVGCYFVLRSKKHTLN